MKRNVMTTMFLVLLFLSISTGIGVGAATTPVNGTAASDTFADRASAPPLSGLVAGINAQTNPDAALAPTACSTPVTQNIRGKDVDFDQCYERTFSHAGTNYTVHVYYTEQDTTANLNRCSPSNPDDYAGRCEHKISNNDDTNGDNVNAVAIAQESEKAMKFYKDRNLPFLWSGTTLTVYIAEDPRGGGTPTCNAIQVDDEWIDDTDVLKKRLLAFHEMQHLIQCHYQPTPGWDGFYGEGISRAIEDRVENPLDGDTGHLFIPEVNGILGNNMLRSSDLSTYDYPTVLWWTWLMDQYRTGSETAPVLGWTALRNFYLGVPGASSTMTAVRNFISGQGSSFRKDFTDYTLALYAYRYTNSKPRLDFLDSEINTSGNALSGHTVINSGPAFSTSTIAMNPRSSRYWEFNPASQCQFIAFTFNGNSKPYSFSVMTVDNSNNLQKNWTSYGTSWARTVRTSGLNRVVGVVTAIDDSGNVSVGRGCVTPSIQIKNPTSSQFEMVGTADNPRNFIVRLKVTGQGGGAVAGLTASDFTVQLRKAGTTATINATILNSTYVQDDYWLLVRAPNASAGAENGQFYDLIANLGSASDSEGSAVLYVPRSQDTIVVLDRSGSMGGTTGRIEAARNAAAMFINELADTDQGGYVAFDTNSVVQENLDQVNSGLTSHRQDLIDAIGAEVPLDYTSIGDGLLAAAINHDTHKNPTNQCSFILLSDGYENEPQYWADVQAQVVDNGCAIHAVGLGPEANEVLLQQIAAAVPGGSYDYADTSGGVPILAPSVGDSQMPVAPEETLQWQNNLSRIYDFKAAQVAGRQRIQATTGGREQKEAQYEFYVDDASGKLVISLGWQFAADNQSMELYDPNGDPVVPGTALGPGAGPSAVRRVQPTNEVWEVTDLIPGNYMLVVKNLFQEYFLGLSVESLYEMHLFIGTPIENLLQGAKVPIFVAFVGPDGPLTGADVQITVRNPNGILIGLSLFDDGNHMDGEADDGVYGNLYSVTGIGDAMSTNPTEGEEPSVIGSYLVNAVGTKGDLRREAQGSFAIQEDKDENNNLLPDGWEKLYGVSDPDDDPDGDKLNTYCEFNIGTDPLNSDTDGGGESDGSEVPQCFLDPNGQNPFDPSDDRTGRLSGVFIRPEFDLQKLLPFLRLWWGDPMPGKLVSVNIYRRMIGTDGTPGGWSMVAQGQTGNEYKDYDVKLGENYQYRLEPLVSTEQGQSTAGVEESTVATPSSDPYPPGGSVQINGGAQATTILSVTLDLAADDLYGSNDGPPPPPPTGQAPETSQPLPGTPTAGLMVRVSNSPDFSAAQWTPFTTEMQWNLGNQAPNSTATVYVQFMDEQGNISYSGFGQTDTILYAPPYLYLPLIVR